MLYFPRLAQTIAISLARSLIALIADSQLALRHSSEIPS